MVRKFTFRPVRATAFGLSLAFAGSLTSVQLAGAEETPLIAATPVRPVDESPRRLEVEAAPAPKFSAVESDAYSDLASEREIIEERYPSGSLKIKREVSQDSAGNYRNNGAWIMYNEKGGVIAAGTFKEGVRDGKWEREYGNEEGKLFTEAASQGFQRPLISQANFKDGVLDGEWTIIDAQDRTVCTWEFVEGERHGESEWFFANGKKRRESNYSHGQLDGEVIDFDVAGKTIAVHKYVRGGKLVKVEEFHSPGKLKKSGIEFAPQATIDSYDWWTGSAKTVPPASKDMIKTGTWTWWFPSGQMQMLGAYENNQPNGKFTWWYTNGQEQLIGNYDHGQAEGKFTWWFIHGQKQMETHYAGGVLSGTWSRWAKDGKIIERGDYAAGISPVGEGPEAAIEETRIDVKSPQDPETASKVDTLKVSR